MTNPEPDPLNTGAHHYLDYLRATTGSIEEAEALRLWDAWRQDQTQLASTQALHRAVHSWHHTHAHMKG